jgi:16S rRNA (uracil1498-N3)-methyltransferase
MQIYRFYCNPIHRPTAELAGPEAHHLISVLRLTTGEKVELFDGAGTLATASIARIEKRKVTLKIEQVDKTPPRATGRIIIAPGIAKGERFDWLIEKCTELRTSRITPVIFERSVKLAANPKIIERWTNIAIAAAKQSKRLFLPKIDLPMPLADVLRTLKKEYPGCRLLAGGLSADAAPLAAQPFGPTDVAVFIGPEGGFTEAEHTLLKEHDVRFIRLTDTVMRTETAALAFASVLCALRDISAK